MKPIRLRLIEPSDLAEELASWLRQYEICNLQQRTARPTGHLQKQVTDLLSFACGHVDYGHAEATTLITRVTNVAYAVPHPRMRTIPPVDVRALEDPETLVDCVLMAAQCQLHVQQGRRVPIRWLAARCSQAPRTTLKLVPTQSGLALPLDAKELIRRADQESAELDILNENE